MADNVEVRDASNNVFDGAAKELADGSYSPKVSILDGTTSATPISPATSGNQSTLNTSVGATNESAAGSDTATSGLNGRLQRIAQRTTSLIALVPAALTGSGNFKTALQEAIPAGSNLIGRTAADASAATGGIASTGRVAASGASTNATNLKTSAGRVYGVKGKNTAAYDVFLVLYDAATNPPVPGTTAIRCKICIPAGNAFALDWPLGMSFANGIGYAFTKLGADADTTAIAANDVVAFNLDYV